VYWLFVYEGSSRLNGYWLEKEVMETSEFIGDAMMSKYN
jgi:hypothetical protein